MLYDDAQLIEAWHYALQWLQTEMEKVSIAAFAFVLVHMYLASTYHSVASLCQLHIQLLWLVIICTVK